MIQTTTILPGVTLRYYHDTRFKQGGLSVQLLRPMKEEEAGMNALLPAVLMRGSRNHPDLRAIIRELDDLYGASVGATARRIGDYQTTGLSAVFMEDRFALSGDKILGPLVDFLRELLREPVLEEGSFSPEFVESEKINLISAIDSQRNDKRIYAAGRMMEEMCSADTFGIPRLGRREQVAAITPQALYAHYRRILLESPVELFYVGSAPMEEVAALVRPLFEDLPGERQTLAPQTPFRDGGKREITEEMDVAQGKLCMGFTTPITTREPDFAAMQVLNNLFGGGMISKLFMHVREQLSLCYDISSSYHGTKGILTVGAGIDCDQFSTVRAEILAQLDDCRAGNITREELAAAKETILSSLRGTHDSPGAIEGYYASAALSGLAMTPAEYAAAVEKVAMEDVTRAAASLELHTVYFLKGVEV